MDRRLRVVGRTLTIFRKGITLEDGYCKVLPILSDKAKLSGLRKNDKWGMSATGVNLAGVPDLCFIMNIYY